MCQRRRPRVSRTNWVVAIVLTGYHRQTTAAIQGRSPRRSSEPRIVRAPCSRRGSISPSALETETPVGDRDPEQRSLTFRGRSRWPSASSPAARRRPSSTSPSVSSGPRGRPAGTAVESVPVHRERAGELHLSARMRVGRMDLPSSCATAGPPNQPSAANTACWTRGSRSRAESRTMLRHSVCQPRRALRRRNAIEIGATRSWRTASSTGMAASVDHARARRAHAAR